MQTAHPCCQLGIARSNSSVKSGAALDLVQIWKDCSGRTLEGLIGWALVLSDRALCWHHVEPHVYIFDHFCALQSSDHHVTMLA